MRFFYNWLAKKCQKALEENNKGQVLATKSVSALESISINSHGMNFTVYRANGGHVIETRKYDRKHDRNDNSLHIITDDKDLGEEIGKILTFENLRS